VQRTAKYLDLRVTTVQSLKGETIRVGTTPAGSIAFASPRHSLRCSGRITPFNGRENTKYSIEELSQIELVGMRFERSPLASSRLNQRPRAGEEQEDAARGIRHARAHVGSRINRSGA
jgi:hypothetical protein